MAARKNPKLSARYYGPFEILDRVGQVAYRLRLPEGSQIHPVFHISQLKQIPSSNSKIIPTAPLTEPEGKLLAEPKEVLDRCTIRRGRGVVEEALVKCSILPRESATWEDCKALRKRFPKFDP